MRRAAKRDDNEALIVRALGSAGWTVVRVSDSGAPDLLCARMGELRLVEVKGPKGTLTPTQEVAFERLNKAGVTVLVVRSPADALEALGVTCYDSRYVAENGAFLCEQCWLPENGLHAKDCPTRQALKVPGKVKPAYRAAKEATDILPKKTHQERLNEAGAVDLRDNMRLEHLGGGYARALPIDPTKRHGAKEAQDVLPKKREDPRKATLEDFTNGAMGVRPPRGVEGELQPLKVKRLQQYHQWGEPDAEEVRECNHCGVRSVRAFAAWQKRKGGHWRQTEQQLIPDCTGPKNLPAATNGA